MKTVLIWLTLCFGTLMTTCANGTAYLFSYFINDSKDGLHLAELDRPERWQVIPDPCRG